MNRWTIIDLVRDGECLYMHEIEVSETYPTDADTIEDEISPVKIIEYESTYEIQDVRQTEEGWSIAATAEDLEITLKFTKLENGYAYCQEGDSGPFEKMRTAITYEEVSEEETAVVITSRFTFGLPFSVITDRIAGWSRKMELRRVLVRLEHRIFDQS